MKLTAQLAKSQLRINRRRTLWTLIGIILSTGLLSAVYGLGFGTGLDFVDRIWGDSPSIDTYMSMITSLALILSIFILSIAVIVVSNAFRVSASERFSQFGILKSVGATQKQIVETIVFEGLFLTVIGIPLGLILGIFLQFIVVEVINHFFMQIDPIGIEELGGFLNFIVSPLSILISVVVSLGTVYLSAWLPARKASRVPAINAIRGIGEVKVKNKKVRFNPFISKVFKIEGLLAAKFLKRSKNNFRATVIALSFSVILVIAAGGMLTQLARTAEMGFGASKSNVMIWLIHEGEQVETEEGWLQLPPERIMSLPEVHEKTLLLESYLEEGDNILFHGSESIGNTTYPLDMVSRELRDSNARWANSLGEELTDEMLTNGFVRFIALTPQHYLELAERAGVEPGGLILLNFTQDQDSRGRRSEFAPFNFDYQTLMVERISQSDGQSEELVEVKLAGQLLRDDIPVEIRDGLWGSSATVLVPDDRFGKGSYIWSVEAADPSGFLEMADAAFAEWQQEDGITLSFQNLQSTIDESRMMVSLISVLTLSFVSLLVAIALTNVISTISENVRTRSKEFAVLQSMGMTREGIKRMLGLEALLSSMKALFFGLPAGALVTYALHQAMGIGFSFEFQMPWLPMAGVTVATFIITWLTMLYAANKLKGSNIIETIRGGNN